MAFAPAGCRTWGPGASWVQAALRFTSAGSLRTLSRVLMDCQAVTSKVTSKLPESSDCTFIVAKALGPVSKQK